MIAPSATFPVIMRWFLIQIAYNIENVVKSDKVVRTNGALLYDSMVFTNVRRYKQCATIQLKSGKGTRHPDAILRVVGRARLHHIPQCGLFPFPDVEAKVGTLACLVVQAWLAGHAAEPPRGGLHHHQDQLLGSHGALLL